MSGHAEILYREEQPWRRFWTGPVMIIGGLAIVGPFVPIMYRQLILGIPVGDRPAPDGALWVLGILMLIIGGGILALGLVGGLVTEVRRDAVYVQHRLLTRQHRIDLADIRACDARSYNPITEFGGWGIRRGLFGKGRAYNVAGNRGVQLELRDGKRLLIGSQQADSLAAAINGARGAG